MERNTAGIARPLTALDIIYGRRSVRAYAQERLDESTIRGLLDAAVQAPTAMREQLWTFAIVQDRTRLRRLSDRVKAQWLRDAVTPAALHEGPESALHGEFLKRLSEPDFSVFYDAPVLIAVCTRGAGPFVAADCWLAAENLMLAASALGLGTCCIGAAVPVLNSPEGRVELGIPADVTVIAPIVVGVPSDPPQPAPRREPDVVAWR